ncbi:conserved hypothetical protein [Thiomonas arsenitoxydans]|uniref:Uncharacterized protein n=1 Tax=Thiomonas arsenitoxydans (strain DSM 22701 / CIP 110005 / 3As) TaxID=426114 RepID=D6CTL6_THIA3|nr:MULTISPECIES: hypothetical protein [Burkholderiales]CQR44476.1 conserved hypothetical protein [Thiomonas sp. CB3]AHB78646.1 hypothetical protein X636_18660 [Pandoraea pnomenusa]CAZ88635.1 hypothetical protein THI_1972 [Thiomonas arsenitoxydans]CQR27746.1 conserved hypothetical protein [Thiomonas arsenitoxydans]CQR32049.1 conserved hypothetical protein [Thiomonas arsenitoxydans]
MTEPQPPQSTIDALRAEIDQIPSPEFRLLARYIEAFHQKHSEEFAEMKQTFLTAKGGARAVMWLSVVGSGLAVIWGVLHGVIKP